LAQEIVPKSVELKPWPRQAALEAAIA